MSDNVVHFPHKPPLKLEELNRQVLIVRKDGTKVRPPTMTPVYDLPRDELLQIIDQLCEVLRGRRR